MMGDLSYHYSRSEVACHCGCGLDSIDAATLEVMEAVREHFERPVTVNSAFRCASHNAAVGGASNSQHLYGRAADLAVDGIDPSEVADFVESGPLKDKGGIGRYATFCHVDSRTNGPSRWEG
jgi:uncharacterized protein YcbK (DUF882 family)